MLNISGGITFDGAFTFYHNTDRITTTFLSQSDYTTFQVPDNIQGGTITVKAWGAGGGAGYTVDPLQGYGGVGGGGGFATAEIPVTPGETLGIRLGGGGVAGWRGQLVTSGNAGSGGGQVGIYRGLTPLLIAGSGGGGGGGSGAGNGTGNRNGGSGGGGGSASGAAGNPASLNTSLGGGGGTQSAGGAGGAGGTATGGNGTNGLQYSGGHGGDAVTTATTAGGQPGGSPYGGYGGKGAIAGINTGGGGGGGGAGYWGGGGGEAAGTGGSARGGAGGGGGSGYVTGTNTSMSRGETSADGVATGGAAANNTDPDYAYPAGVGGSANTSGGVGGDGNPGLVVITYTIPRIFAPHNTSPIVFTYDSNYNNQARVSFSGPTYVEIAWGDGSNTITSVTSVGGTYTHRYANANTYSVSIRGTTSGISIPSGYREGVTQFTSWGDLQGISYSSMKFQDFVNLANVPVTLHGSITNLSNMFNNCSVLDDPNITLWDTSNVTNMSSMFMNATDFNQDISGWNTSKVTDMSYLFKGAISFGQSLENWNTSNVTNMRGMFEETNAFNGNIVLWNTSKVTNMANIFAQCTDFTRDISAWNVSNVTTLANAFSGAVSFNANISAWNVSNVTTLEGMFADSFFNNDISAWNTSKVTNMAYLFQDNSSYNQPLTSWNLSLVSNVKGMFNNASSFDQSLANWNMSQVVTLEDMFHGASAFNGNVIPWNVSACTNFTNTFKDALNFNQDISTWVLYDNETYTFVMDGMFQGATVFNQNLNSWSVGAVTSMNYMFKDAASFYQDLTNWCVNGKYTSVTPDHTDFATGSPMPVYYEPAWGTCPESVMTITHDATTYKTANIYLEVGSNASINWGYWNSASQVTTISSPSAAYYTVTYPAALTGSRNITVTGNVTYVALTTGSTGIQEFGNLPIQGFKVSDTTTAVPRRLPRTLANLSQTFKDATVFNDTALIYWNTSNVTNMSEMFSGATAFNQNISGWNTGNVTNMASMFNNASVFNQYLVPWDVTNIPTRPSDFSTASGLSVSNEPQWGITPLKLNYSTETSYSGSDVSLYLETASNALVFWGDGSYTAVSNSNTYSHTYTTMPLITDKTISVRGSVTYFRTGTGSENGYTKLLSFGGNLGLTGFSLAFAEELANVPASLPGTVTNLSGAFENCFVFNDANVVTWNTANVANMSGMFNNAVSFNCNIGAWSVGNVTNMNSMFLHANTFDQNLTGWCVTNIASEPLDFATDSTLNANNKPVWGTCP